MKSYETIQKISRVLYTNLKNENDVKIRLEGSVLEIHSQISADFYSLFGLELMLQDSHIYVGDETYRQSSTGLVLSETILDHAEFKIRVEYLVDHGRIWIKVQEGRENLDFMKIINRIEKVQNLEGLSELKEIK